MCFWLTLAGTSNCTDKMSNCPDFEKNGKCPDRARCPHAHPIAPKNLADEMKSAADPPAAANVGDPGSKDATSVGTTTKKTSKASKTNKSSKASKDATASSPRFNHPCRDFLKHGRCKFGNGCKFSHSQDGGVAPSTVKTPAKCNTFHESGQCRFGSKCRFLHGQPDPAASAKNKSVSFQESRPCHAFIKGRCSYGSSCKFSHGGSSAGVATSTDGSDGRKRGQQAPRPAAMKRNRNGASGHSNKRSKLQVPTADDQKSKQRDSVTPGLLKAWNVVASGLQTQKQPSTDSQPKSILKKSLSVPAPATVCDYDPMTTQHCVVLVSPYVVGIFSTQAFNVAVSALFLPFTAKVAEGGWSECCDKLKEASSNKSSTWFQHQIATLNQHIGRPISRIRQSALEFAQMWEPALKTSFSGELKPSWLRNTTDLRNLLSRPLSSAVHPDKVPRRASVPPFVPVGWVAGDPHASPTSVLFLFYGFFNSLDKFMSKNKWLPVLGGRTVLLDLSRSTLAYPRFFFPLIRETSKNGFATGLAKVLIIFFPWLNNPKIPPYTVRDVDSHGPYPAWVRDEGSPHTRSMFEHLQRLVNTVSNIQAGVEDYDFHGLSLLCSAYERFVDVRDELLAWTFLLIRPASPLRGEAIFSLGEETITAHPCPVASLFMDQPRFHYATKSSTPGRQMICLYVMDKPLSRDLSTKIQITPDILQNRSMRVLVNVERAILNFFESPEITAACCTLMFRRLCDCAFGCQAGQCTAPQEHGCITWGREALTDACLKAEKQLKVDLPRMHIRIRKRLKGSLQRLRTVVQDTGLRGEPIRGVNHLARYRVVIPPPSLKSLLGSVSLPSGSDSDSERTVSVESDDNADEVIAEGDNPPKNPVADVDEVLAKGGNPAADANEVLVAPGVPAAQVPATRSKGEQVKDDFHYFLLAQAEQEQQAAEEKQALTSGSTGEPLSAFSKEALSKIAGT